MAIFPTDDIDPMAKGPDQATTPTNEPIPPERDPTKSLENLLEQATRLGDFEFLHSVITQPGLPPEYHDRIENLMVEVLVEPAIKQGAKEDAFIDTSMEKPGGTEDPRLAVSRETTLQRISKLTVGEKLRVALFGTKEERFLLIRSVNKIIAGAVLKSPKLTSGEVELIASMRNVHQEVLTTIGESPTWARYRPIVMNLIRNPRTPVALSLRLLRQANTHELQVIARDRGISEIVRRTAQRSALAARQRANK